MATRIKLRPYGDDRDRDVTRYYDLDGVRVGIRARWSAFDGLGRIWLTDLDGVIFAGPVTLVPGLDLTRQYRYDPRVPQGEMFVHGLGRATPSFSTIDVDQFLTYRTVAEVT